MFSLLSNIFTEAILLCQQASLVTQMVKNPPAIQEMLVGSLGQEDPLVQGKAIHSSNPA